MSASMSALGSADFALWLRLVGVGVVIFGSVYISVGDVVLV